MERGVLVLGKRIMFLFESKQSTTLAVCSRTLTAVCTSDVYDGGPKYFVSRFPAIQRRH